jgi:hypothetical protein
MPDLVDFHHLYLMLPRLERPPLPRQPPPGGGRGRHGPDGRTDLPDILGSLPGLVSVSLGVMDQSGVVFPPLLNRFGVSGGWVTRLSSLSRLPPDGLLLGSKDQPLLSIPSDTAATISLDRIIVFLYGCAVRETARSVPIAKFSSKATSW